jgi:hypothetical protein
MQNEETIFSPLIDALFLHSSFFILHLKAAPVIFQS